MVRLIYRTVGAGFTVSNHTVFGDDLDDGRIERSHRCSRRSVQTTDNRQIMLIDMDFRYTHRILFFLRSALIVSCSQTLLASPYPPVSLLWKFRLHPTPWPEIPGARMRQVRIRWLYSGLQCLLSGKKPSTFFPPHLRRSLSIAFDRPDGSYLASSGIKNSDQVRGQCAGRRRSAACKVAHASSRVLNPATLAENVCSAAIGSWLRR